VNEEQDEDGTYEITVRVRRYAFDEHDAVDHLTQILDVKEYQVVEMSDARRVST
jgi:hypothetical protein